MSRVVFMSGDLGSGVKAPSCEPIVTMQPLRFRRNSFKLAFPGSKKCTAFKECTAARFSWRSIIRFCRNTDVPRTTRLTAKVLQRYNLLDWDHEPLNY